MNKIARIISGKIVYADDSAPTIRPTETAARSKRQDMRTKHRGDLLQPNQTDYYKKYPEKLNDLNDETKRLLS